jgi:hypothetical protein
MPSGERVRFREDAFAKQSGGHREHPGFHGEFHQQFLAPHGNHRALTGEDDGALLREIERRAASSIVAFRF